MKEGSVEVATMCLLLTALSGAAGAELVRETWGPKDSPVSHPGTVTVLEKPARIVFDLSAVGKGAKVHHASLFCVTKHGGQPNEPARLLREGTDGPAFPLEAPWFNSFDVTAAAAAWVAHPEENRGIRVASFDGLLADRATIEVLYEGPGLAAPPQATGIRAVHHDGQTFVIWEEHAAFRPKPADTIWIELMNRYTEKTADGPGQGHSGFPRLPAIRLDVLRGLQGYALRDKPSPGQDIRPLQRIREVPAVRYRVYRHTERITAANLHEAALLAAVEPLSGYDHNMNRIDYVGEFLNQTERSDSAMPTLCYEDGKAILPGETLYVHTAREKGPAYYAVTVVSNGTENVAQFSDANATSVSVDEGVATPRPVLQYLQYEDPDKGAKEHWFKLWAAPPIYHLPMRMFHICIHVPTKTNSPPGMAFGGMQSGFNMRSAMHAPGGGDLATAVEGPKGEVMYNAGLGTLRAASECQVDYFPDRYYSSVMEWAIRKWGVDRSRIGCGVRGSGPLHFAIRHPELFATMDLGNYTATYDPRWAPGSASLAGLLGPKGTKTVDGEDAWEMSGFSGYFGKYPNRDIPFLTCQSSTGKDTGHTSEFGWQDDPRGWFALQQAREPFVAAWSCELSRELLRLIGKTDWSKTIPAFSRCSLDNNPGRGDPYDGDYYGQINGWLAWDNAQSVDEKDRWEMTVFVIPSCPVDACQTDITPRRCQTFKAAPGDTFKWTNTSLADGKAIQSGTVTADKHGLVTLEKVVVAKGKNEVVVSR